MNDGWTDWHGGECPVAKDTQVELILRSGQSGGNLAGECAWGHDDPTDPFEIVQYRVVEAVAPPDLGPGCYDARLGGPLPQELKSSNPKDALGANKLPYHLWPQAATAMGSLGLMEGALKYGRNNWRVHGVLATTYGAAAKRHIDAWLEGEDRTSDSQNFHLSNALACLAIIVDAKANNKLIDDRNYGDAAKIGAFLTELTKEVPRLRTTFAGYAPHHYTIGDYGLETRNNVHPVGAPPLPQAGNVPSREDEQPIQQRDG